MGSPTAVVDALAILAVLPIAGGLVLTGWRKSVCVLVGMAVMVTSIVVGVHYQVDV